MTAIQAWQEETRGRRAFVRSRLVRLQREIEMQIRHLDDSARLDRPRLRARMVAVEESYDLYMAASESLDELLRIGRRSG